MQFFLTILIYIIAGSALGYASYQLGRIAAEWLKEEWESYKYWAPWKEGNVLTKGANWVKDLKEVEEEKTETFKREVE